MNIDLTPIGRPSAFSAACAKPGETLFDPVLFDGGSKILAGGPRLLGIFNAKGGLPQWELPYKTEHGMPEGVKQVLKTSPPTMVYGMVSVLRFLASGTSVALHGVATLKYGDPVWKRNTKG